MAKIAVIVYGDGKELGDFKIFAEGLELKLKRTYKKVVTKYANRDVQFFDLIRTTDINDEIAELHIFAHSIGAGLFLGYGDTNIHRLRVAAITNAELLKKKVTYNEAVRIEVGAIQTDDLLTSAMLRQQADLRSKFSANAFIKIWGCNSGVEDWVYSDQGVVDPKDTSEFYYWRAFNESNIPKPSIARALAKFLNRKVYGARSGSSIEVNYHKKWISSKDYKDKIGKWPSGILPHRLVPDTGKYYEYLP
jgi:hypothetical protein